MAQNDLVQEIKEGLDKKVRVFTNRMAQAELFYEVNAFFYDRNKLFWLWNKKLYRWEICDEVDILNKVEEADGSNIIGSKDRTEILNSLKQVGRLKQPEEGKSSWVQFGKWIWDLEEEGKTEATPKFFITNPIEYDISESDETPEIDKLFESWVSDPNELYELIAFCIVPDYFIHRIFALIGSGANGKSTFLKLLSNFIGVDNIASSSLDYLVSNRFEGAKLYRKLICMMSETNFGTISRTEYLKSLSGGDMIRIEYKGKDPFNTVNYAKLIIATNSLPITLDKTEGFYRRWKIIDFSNKFTKEEDILKKIPEEEYQNLTKKCLLIAQKLWKKRRFSNDGSFDERKRAYEEKSNPTMVFIRTKFVKGTKEEVPFGDFYDELRDFLEEGGHRTLTNVVVSKILREDGYEIKTKGVDIDGRKTTQKVIMGLGKREKLLNSKELEPVDKEFIPFTNFNHISIEDIRKERSENTIKSVKWVNKLITPITDELIEYIRELSKKGKKLIITEELFSSWKNTYNITIEECKFYWDDLEKSGALYEPRRGETHILI